MTIRLKQSTAGQIVPLGPFIASSDGVSVTSPTIASTDIKLWKNGSTTLANKNSGGATAISQGIYHATLDATDTNTLGPLVLFVQVSGSLPVRLECEVLPANVYEALVKGTQFLEVTGLKPTWSVSSNVLTVRAVDGTTTQFTKVLATDGSAQPIVGAS
ncbi:hypothetical protein [Azohydromonas aeria]|uniref:hypothetical protein n=1 Tax=Azohydromonas aeria TaxID=2590212 RepID=UPI0012FBDE4B|nr:hypothetical protein [Azohydromonas aeria]